jgi:hypothetical protein
VKRVPKSASRRKPAPTATSSVAGHNTQHWNRGPALYFIEDQVWSISRDQCRPGARACQPFHLDCEIIGHLCQLVRCDQVDQLLAIDAVDHERGRAVPPDSVGGKPRSISGNTRLSFLDPSRR